MVQQSHYLQTSWIKTSVLLPSTEDLAISLTTFAVAPPLCFLFRWTTLSFGGYLQHSPKIYILEVQNGLCKKKIQHPGHPTFRHETSTLWGSSTLSTSFLCLEQGFQNLFHTGATQWHPNIQVIQEPVYTPFRFRQQSTVIVQPHFTSFPPIFPVYLARSTTLIHVKTWSQTPAFSTIDFPMNLKILTRFWWSKSSAALKIGALHWARKM